MAPQFQVETRSSLLKNQFLSINNHYKFRFLVPKWVRTKTTETKFSVLMKTVTSTVRIHLLSVPLLDKSLLVKSSFLTGDINSRHPKVCRVRSSGQFRLIFTRVTKYKIKVNKLLIFPVLHPQQKDRSNSLYSDTPLNDSVN